MSRRSFQKLLPLLLATISFVALLGAVVGLVWVRSDGQASSRIRWRTKTDWHTFPTLPTGTALPSGEACAQRVHRSSWEPRPENSSANKHMPSTIKLPDWEGYDRRANTRLKPRIDGRFTGTTDDILQWASCKWGIDTDVVRAMAVQETEWVQNSKGDYTSDRRRCVAGDTVPCPVSFGLLQIKYYNHPGTYPSSLLSTAFNVDYSLGAWRACYAGWVSYLGRRFGPGDLWGCVGHHYSGAWHDPAGDEYARKVRGLYEAKPWRSWRGWL